MRPVSIAWFDRLYWFGFAAACVNFVVNIGNITSKVGNEPGATAAGIAGGLFGFGLVMALWTLLWFFTSRKANNITRWLYTVIVWVVVLFTLVGLFVALEEVGMVAAVLDVLRFGSWAAGSVLLFFPDSRAYFSAGGTVDEDVFK
ncbi:MAG: hypothetical protein H6918_03335 [Sphingomonadaceae bacterium]|nr:hypothetical protein [Sphingomonadaceae bacterium]